MAGFPARLEPESSEVIRYVDLLDEELRDIDRLLGEIGERPWSPGEVDFLDQALPWACRLPDRIVTLIRGFRLHETESALVLSGLPVDDDLIGPTPLDWKEQSDRPRTRRHEFYLMLICALLGDVFGWSTLQNAQLIHNVVPMPTEEKEQSGHGTVKLEWHTEDGFHPFRCDYLLLLGLRNHDRVPTTVSCVDEVRLSAAHRRTLAEPRFLIRPDNEHLHRAAELAGPAGGRHHVYAFQETPAPCAVLFGHPEKPYLRVDPAFMEPVAGDREAAAALRELVDQLEERLRSVVLGPGDLLIVDNYKAVHGRSAFKARFDGTDRWLKKAVASRDLRKSRASRATAGSRILL